MEKLQKALENARKTRGTGADGNDAPPPAEEHGGTYARRSTRSRLLKETEAAPSFPPVWESLTPYEPNPDLLAKNRVTTLNAQVAPNPFDILRTKVFLMMRENGWKRLAITSPTKSCGKTTTACNLAVGLSRQRDTKTMLFDTDLRRPGVATMLGRKPAHSIRALLSGEVTAQEQLLCLRSNVALSMARGPVADPTQLLLAGKTKNMFHELQDAYEPDIMIFDLPPMLVTDDAQAFLKNVDCALIVARAEQTKISQLDICEREVGEQTNVLGVVLNSCRHLPTANSDYEEYV